MRRVAPLCDRSEGYVWGFGLHVGPNDGSIFPILFVCGDSYVHNVQGSSTKVSHCYLLQAICSKIGILELDGYG